MNIGFGYDIHPLVEGRELILGGIKIPFSKGLDGHSDADCLVHAICDAILGAVGEGDIGEKFPDTQAQYRNISSIILLKEVLQIVKNKGYRINNVDTTIVADYPHLTPFKNAMRESLAKCMGLEKEKVSIKATTSNGLSLFANDGIAAYAIVCIEV